MSHTPGPWICHSGMVWKDGPNVYPKGKEDGVPIARMDREPGNGTMPVERDENAWLIAAAPELLAVCNLIVNKHYDDAVGRTAVEQARAAIAKAEGEPH